MNAFYGTLVLVSFPLLIRSDFDFGLQKDKKPKVNRKKKPGSQSQSVMAIVDFALP